MSDSYHSVIYVKRVDNLGAEYFTVEKAKVKNVVTRVKILTDEVNHRLMFADNSLAG